MKVDGQLPKVPLSDKHVQKGKEQEAIAQKLQAQKKAAQLKAMQTGQFTVNKIKDSINATDDIDLEKVNALKAKIKSGEYQIDKAKLAQNILEKSIVEDT